MIWDVILAVGILFIVAGFSWIWPPLGLILGGLLLAFIGVEGSKRVRAQ